MNKTNSLLHVKPDAAANAKKKYDTSSQESYFDMKHQTLGFISPAEAEALWAKFEADFPAILAELKFKHPDIDIKQLFIGSFIGRTNPPHDGHIMAIQTVILNALSREGGSALILLGSGPGKMSNAQNPIPFQLKRLFIIRKLIEINSDFTPNLFKNGKINILEMDKPVAQTTSVFSEQVSPDIILLVNILFVGNKEGDAKKLTFYSTGVGKGITVDGIYYPIKTSIISIDPITTDTDEPMSATKVREFVKNNTLEEFRLAFGGFYNIFPTISDLLQFLSEEKQLFVDKYRPYIRNDRLDFANLFYDIIQSEFEKATTVKAVKAVKVKVAEVVPIEVVPPTAVEMEVTPTAAAPKVKAVKVKAVKAVKEVAPIAVEMEVTDSKRNRETVVETDTKKNRNAGGSRKRRKTKRKLTKRRKTRRKLTKRRKTRRKLIKRRR